MRLLDLDRLVTFGLPVLVEGFVEFDIELTGRVVGHVEQGFGGHGGTGDQCAGQGGER